MNVVKATQRFERWLEHEIDVVKHDLERKHKEMSNSCFSFFRATCYRWAQRWSQHCLELDAAPSVVAVGDLHVENFGTWRDKEGRLVWGINDFDEAFLLPYTADLVRLGASVGVARDEECLKTALPSALDSILDGYKAGFECGGCPFVLSENETALRKMARHRLTNPEKFWKKLTDRQLLAEPPRRVRRYILDALDVGRSRVTFAHRIAGLGSLGHQRFIGWTDWHAAKIAREAKARSPSAWAWAGRHAPVKDYYRTLLTDAVRCPDPTVEIRQHWLIRRLSPDCSRIELEDLPTEKDEDKLLWSMGKEMANVHLGSVRPAVIVKHLRQSLKPKAFKNAVNSMIGAVQEDWAAWKMEFPPSSRQRR